MKITRAFTSVPILICQKTGVHLLLHTRVHLLPQKQVCMYYHPGINHVRIYPPEKIIHRPDHHTPLYNTGSMPRHVG
jgi:hypothetical protein